MNDFIQKTNGVTFKNPIGMKTKALVDRIFEPVPHVPVFTDAGQKKMDMSMPTSI